ncbi:sigma 54-interacting transcriptional regulator [Bradyrhizobium brasilense]|uniref:sigma-54 interaction domain-containing protein n=1 Tax=Bradyrhizobium brasilense TaxID=1419277 RepID=UPI0024B0B06C|nr:sigma 54-interacting transcriptional regulator [Bradyrhizobium australafricanum]WFU31705.1 sigma 54-interacting transcriptional regulator [Bradyrhizobium australafricanum]
MVLSQWIVGSSEEAGFLRLVLDHVSDCLVAVDTSGTIVLINHPYCRLLGGTAEDFIGRHITDVVGSQTKLHLVARGEGSHVGYPLKVRGHQLITRQVPVLQDGRIIGAVGLALFSDLGTLKRTFRRVSQSELAIPNGNKPWRSRYTMEDIVGEGALMDAYRNSLQVVAGHNLPVLISGETGCGKELAAHTIHAHSARADGPFVWINCASIPTELIEAELFGYEGGAFTGARSRGKLGKFELASGGTLFLDEIGDMPLHLQGSLLRVLQTNELVRVGGTTPVAVNTRIICATNRSVLEMARAGRFRQDLYYRLSVLPIEVPSLRDRDDVAFLAQQLLIRIAARLDASPKGMTRSEIASLAQHRWPGNVRELENVLTRFLVTGKLTLGTADFISNPEAEENEPKSLKQGVQSQTAVQIRTALERSGGNKRQAAELLGISRTHLYRLMKEHGYEPRRGTG